MRAWIRAVAAGATLLSGGCAIVPDMESKDSFNYTEIINQVECELYNGFEVARIKNDADKKAEPDVVKANFEPGEYSALLSVLPIADNQAGFTLPFTGKSSLGSGFYRSLGGGGGLAGSPVAFDESGETNINNQYSLNGVNLYLLKSDVDENAKKKPAQRDNDIPAFEDGFLVYPNIKVDNKNLQVKARPSPIPDTEYTVFLAEGHDGSERRVISQKLMKQCKWPQTVGAQDAVYNYPAQIGGALGLDTYIQESVAAAANGTVKPKTLTFFKQYKMTVQAGASVGWYAPYSSFAPTAGGSKKLNDTISVALSYSPTPAPSVQMVCVVHDKKAKTCPEPGGAPAPRLAGAPPKAMASSRRTPSDLRPANSEAIRDLSTLQILQHLQLPQ